MELKKEIHHVREAVKDDCHQIMEFIRMLARYGNYEEIITTDVNSITVNGFPENEPPKFKCLICQDDKYNYSGFLTYNNAYTLWEGSYYFLINIFVDSQFRRMGIGKKLYKKLAKIAVNENISKINLCIVGWNQLSMDFHQSLGAVNLTIKEGYDFFQFDEKSIQRLANFKDMENETHHVREAVKDDCYQIMELIKMDVRYENMKDSIKDAETLIRDGFPENGYPKFKCIVSHDDNNKISGYLIYNYFYLTYQGEHISMKDLFVDPSFRRMKIGTKMMSKLAEIANSNCIVDIFIIIPGTNQSLIDFYESIGAVNLSKKRDLNFFEFDRKSIEQLASSN